MVERNIISLIGGRLFLALVLGVVIAFDDIVVVCHVFDFGFELAFYERESNMRMERERCLARCDAKRFFVRNDRVTVRVTISANPEGHN